MKIKLSFLYRFTDFRMKVWKRVKDVDYVQAEDKSVVFYFRNGTKRVENGHIAEHEKVLDKSGLFYRIHRSCLVNLQAIRGIDGDGTITLASEVVLHCVEERLKGLLARFPG